MNEFNSFIKWKALLHKEHLDSIVSGRFLPPYCVCTDPTNDCVNNCIYCNSKSFREVTSKCYMPDGHLSRIADFYKDWGISSTIIEGGGEPLLHHELPQFIEKLRRFDIEIGLITNGMLLNQEYFDILPECARFVGVSFDAATPETYNKMRGANGFNIVTNNIAKLTANKKSLDVTMKFLIHEYNYHEIYGFAKLAKDLGCTCAHIKPCSFENLNIEKFDLSLHINKINEHLEKCKELEDDNFNVYSITYKFSENLQHKIKFSKCECTPIGGVFGADGSFWLCFNMRGEKGFNLGAHYPDPHNIARLWGGKYHKELISKIDITKCMRCGLTATNEIIENSIRKDSLFWKFL